MKQIGNSIFFDVAIGRYRLEWSSLTMLKLSPS